MVDTINRKLQIIKSTDDASLDAIESTLNQATINDSIEDTKPAESIETLIQEQAYTSPSAEDFFAQAQKAGIEEPLNELLAMLD